MVARNPWILPTAVFLMLALLAAVVFGGSAIAQAFISQGPGTGSILHVPDNYSTIQSAINAASSGDIIQVAPGTYNETITLNKAVALTATSSNSVNAASNTTVLDGGNGQATILIPAGLTQMPSIQGFVIRNSKDGIEAHSEFNAEDNYFYGSAVAVEYAQGSGGTNRGNVYFHSGDDAIRVDDISVPLLIENNRFMYAGDDSVEVQLAANTAPTSMVETDIWNNMLIGSAQDGIKFVDSGPGPLDANRRFVVAGNLIANNRQAGIGFMHSGNTNEDFSGVSTDEPVRVYNNTFYGNNYGLSGGANLVAFNDIIANSTSRGAWRVQGPQGANSVIAYTLFWANGLNTDQTLLGAGNIIQRDPLFVAAPNPGPDGAWGTVDDDFSGLLLQQGSPAIDRGVTQYMAADGELVPPTPLTGFLGAAPDLGWREAGEPVFITPTPVLPATATALPTATVAAATTAAPATATTTATAVTPTTASPTAAASATPTRPGASPSPTKIPQASATPLIGIVSIAPASAGAGTSVMLTITGFGFQSGTAIAFQGGQGTAPEVAAVQFVNSTTMIATINAVDSTPRPQTWDVRVTNPGGTSFLLVSAFTVNP
ncbi:MAG TPA: right-handed parallel beta-helix repeat-containing protein [Anaerolineales bacterium]